MLHNRSRRQRCRTTISLRIFSDVSGPPGDAVRSIAKADRRTTPPVAGRDNGPNLSLLPVIGRWNLAKRRDQQAFQGEMNAWQGSLFRVAVLPPDCPMPELQLCHSSGRPGMVHAGMVHDGGFARAGPGRAAAGTLDRNPHLGRTAAPGGSVRAAVDERGRSL